MRLLAPSGGPLDHASVFSNFGIACALVLIDVNRALREEDPVDAAVRCLNHFLKEAVKKGKGVPT